MSVRTDVNRTIDHGIETFRAAAGQLASSILDNFTDRNERAAALALLASMNTGYERMGELARLSVTPFDDTGMPRERV